MDFIGLIKGVLLALTAFLELKSKTFFYDINEKSKNKQRELINEIEKLRSSKSGDANDRADILRDELLKERAYIQYLSAQYTLSGKG
jgi:hypothetical protein